MCRISTSSLVPRAGSAIYEATNPGYAGAGHSLLTMKRLSIVTAAVAAALILAACGGSEPTTTTSAEVPLDVVPSSYIEFRAQPASCGAVAPNPLSPMEFEAPTDMGLDSSTPIRVTMSTSCGNIVIELQPAIAPQTVNSFVFLSTEGYFDGTVFHRVIPGFVAQGGDQTATGLGGPGYTVPDEFPPPGVGYDRGVLAMANAGPGTTGSQFFIVIEDTDLPPQYAIFGRVVEGFDVLDRLQEVPLDISPTSPDPVASTPLETIYVDTITIDE
jgi:cyclophilin family peptidyl-prolyl cis-trans isomerase